MPLRGSCRFGSGVACCGPVIILACLGADYLSSCVWARNILQFVFCAGFSLFDVNSLARSSAILSRVELNSFIQCVAFTPQLSNIHVLSFL
jgi:hypothetical protein